MANAPLSPLAALLHNLGVDMAEVGELAPLVAPVAEEPSFTVVVRTQGLRPRTLLEAFESLAGQTWGRFDVIVAVHAEDDAVAAVKESLSGADEAGRAPESWAVLAVPPGGTRARPLNAGLSAASGDYLAFLDDDDLAEPDWLAAFARGVVKAPGQIVRARTARQAWTTSGTAEPRRPLGPVEHVYPAAFDLLAHFSYSETPICSTALPRRALSHLGLRFDEELPVCEDWDLQMRAALILGVHCIEETTSLYRRSDDANSETDSDMAEWRSSRAKVVSKLACGPFVLDGDSALRLAEAHFNYGGGPSINGRRMINLLRVLPKRLRARLAEALPPRLRLPKHLGTRLAKALPPRLRLPKRLGTRLAKALPPPADPKP